MRGVRFRSSRCHRNYKDWHWGCFWWGRWIQQDKAEFARQITPHARHLLRGELRLTRVRSVGHVIVLRQRLDRTVRIPVTVNSCIASVNTTIYIVIWSYFTYSLCRARYKWNSLTRASCHCTCHPRDCGPHSSRLRGTWIYIPCPCLWRCGRGLLIVSIT